METSKITKLKDKINKEYNKKPSKELEDKYNILTCREIINDYLYYGYGIDTFIKNNYLCAKNISIDTIKELFKEQAKIMGGEF